MAEPFIADSLGTVGNITLRNLDKTNSYQFTYNPESWNPEDSINATEFPTIDGMNFLFYSIGENREMSFVWPNYSNSNTNFTAMVSELKSYIGQKKQMHLGNIDYINQGWRNIRITDVSTDVSFGGPLEYNLTLKYIYI